MVSLSNDDFAMVVRLLKAFSKTRGETRREVNERRMAYLLHNKLKKKGEKKANTAEKISYQDKTR